VNDQYPGELVHAVTIANQEDAGATEHLIELDTGGSRIWATGTVTNRTRGGRYKRRWQERGSGLRRSWQSRRRTPDAEMEAVHALLRLNTPPTACCCYNDMTRWRDAAIRARGLRVPGCVGDGFDDLFFAAYLAPALTTVRQPMRQMGQMAMENLFKLMWPGSARR